MFDGIDISSTTEQYRDAHEAAARIYERNGEYRLALAHQKAFKRLEDQGRDIAASANYAILNAEFEFANKELQIEKLRSSELEANAALVAARDRQRQMAFWAVSGLGAFIILFMAYAYLSMRRTQRITFTLNEKLEEKNIELTKTNVDLQEANQIKMEFMAMTSHEIRTPLNAIIGFTDFLSNAEDIPEKQRDYIRIVNESGRGLLQIVNDILDVSRMEAGRIEVNSQPLDVAGVVVDVAELWRSSAEEKGLDFVVSSPCAACSFETDERLVRQLVTNLISNAIKFTPSGSINVRLGCRDGGDGFVVVVSDTGIGIAKEHQETIFESFRQADGSATRDHGGVGLGLAICARIVEVLGGTLSVESAPGDGATFTANIPATPSSSGQSTDKRPRLATVGGRQTVAEFELGEARVLVVDDNPVNADVLALLLRNVGADVETASDGVEAVEAVRHGGFDLVFMDKQMPKLDGVGAIRAIRELDEPLRRTPIIAVTADAYDAARIELSAAGADGYVSKPISIERIREQIDMVFTNRSDALAS